MHSVASPSGWAGCHDSPPVAEERGDAPQSRDFTEHFAGLVTLHVPY